MILDYEPVDLTAVLGLLEQGPELMYLDLPPGESAFANERARSAVTEAVEGFVQAVIDNADREQEARRGLAWLLNQDDETLADLLVRGRTPFPTSDISERRQYLTLLWDRAFASWRIENLDLELHEVLGLPG